MKIRTNFDLIEEATLAKKGFSLKKYSKDVTRSTIINLAAFSPLFIGSPVEEYNTFVLNCIKISLVLYGVGDSLLSGLEKTCAIKRLSTLSNQLGNIYVDTDANMLTEAKTYQTEYKLNFESFPPKLEEHKYIMVPVYSNWDNNERSLHQEHVIGTKAYDLSYGEPEKEKVYSYQMKRVINK